MGSFPGSAGFQPASGQDGRSPSGEAGGSRTKKEARGATPVACCECRVRGLCPYESRDERSYGKTVLPLGGLVFGLFHFGLGGKRRSSVSITIDIFLMTDNIRKQKGEPQ